MASFAFAKWNIGALAHLRLKVFDRRNLSRTQNVQGRGETRAHAEVLECILSERIVEDTRREIWVSSYRGERAARPPNK